MNSDEDCRRLMALLAHEMRSPGAVVAGYLRMLKTSAPELPAREQKMIEEANKSCARLMHIVHELSDLGELEEQDLKYATLPIFTLCDEVVQSVSDDGADVTFVCEDGDRDVKINGHEARLKQAVSSLIASIVRERGTAPVEARGFVARTATPTAVIAFGEPGAMASADEVLKHRQMPFDRWRGGMGLSLPVAHQIVLAHRGSLWALPGSRATCALSLPLTDV
jgi:signal transduction histidine kinase